MLHVSFNTKGDNDEIPLDFTEITSFIDRDVISIDEKEAFCYGLFFAEGSCNYYNCPSGVKYTWAIHNANYIWLQKVANFLREVEGGGDFKILDTMKSSGCYKLARKGKVKSLVQVTFHV